MKPQERENNERKGISWDETNLQLNEEQKVPRMIIDEPPTPYHTLGPVSSDEESSERPNESPKSVSSLGSASKGHLRFSFEAKEVSDEISRKIRDWEDEEEVVEVERDQKKRKQFEAKRKSHYNEFIIAKQLESGADSSADET